MVSFSCDQCQDVFKKPKIEAHMWQCRASSVSCVDCGQTFGIGNVKAHTTCYTEQEKYDGSRRGHNGVGSGRGGGDRNPTYCSICQLAINGAVMAEQHYTSKKHKASLRRIKNDTAKAKKTDRTKLPVDSTNGKEMNVNDNREDAAEVGRAQDRRSLEINGEEEQKKIESSRKRTHRNEAKENTTTDTAKTRRDDEKSRFKKSKKDKKQAFDLAVEQAIVQSETAKKSKYKYDKKRRTKHEKLKTSKTRSS